MAYRTLYWQGSTAPNISSFDFSVATNWKEYLFRDGKYGVYTPTSSPSYADYAYIGDSYMPTGITSPKSPCLFGGYSGNSSSGQWSIGGATGTTFTSGLAEVRFCSANNQSGNYSSVYPFPYLGTGLVDNTLDYITSSWWPGETAGIPDAIAAYPRPVDRLTLKSNQYSVNSIGVAGTVVQFNGVKNIVSSSGATGSTAQYFVSSALTIRGNSTGKRSGTVQIQGGVFDNVYIMNGMVSGHNLMSEQVNFIGVTAGSVKIYGSPNTFFDENCNVGMMDVFSGYWQGPILFGGKLNRSVFNEMFQGLSGATGGTASTSLGSLSISPLAMSGTLGIGGFGTSTVAPYNTPTNTGNKTPIFYFGGRSNTVEDGVVSTANIISVSSSAGVSGSLATARWNVQFAGSAGVSAAYATDAVFSAAPIYVYDENSPEIEKTPEISSEDTISVDSIYLTKYAVLDLSMTPDFNGWNFGYLSAGSLLGGVFFNDETSTIRGSKDMRLVNDTVLAGGRWSQRLSLPTPTEEVGRG